MNGLMGGRMKEDGLREKCIKREFLLGRMEVCTKEIIIMIKRKDMEYLFGLIKKDMRECERMEGSMGKEFCMLGLRF